MGKRAPPVLDDHDQVGRIPEQGDTQRAIELAVENPEGPICAQVVPSGAGGINDLVGVAVTVRQPGRDEIPVRADVHAPHEFQVGSDQQHPQQHKGYCCYQGEINKRYTDSSFPSWLLQIVRTEGNTFIDIIHSLALPGRHKCHTASCSVASVYRSIIRVFFRDRVEKRIYPLACYEFLPVLTRNRMFLPKKRIA